MNVSPRSKRDLPGRVPRIAERMGAIAPFHVIELFTRVKQLERAGHRVINLSVGEPDFTTPEPVLQAAMRALHDGRFPYTQSLGIPPLRAALSAFYRTRYGVAVPAERIIVTAGASGALLLTMGVLVNAEERVLLTDPGYPCNHQFVRLLGGQPIGVPVEATTHYQMTSDLIERYWLKDTVAALIASPANPTGCVMPVEVQRKVLGAVDALGGRLIVDEIYHGITYGFDAPTALALSDEVFVINSFSKYFHMTGWRLGWLVAPQAYVREIEKLAQNLYISTSAPAQYAALAAFEPATIAILETRRREFQARRDYLVPALRELGFAVPVPPDGAFYVYADCSSFTDDSYTFAWEVLEKAHVAMTPGIDFGVNGAKRHLRISYCTGLADLQEGVERLRRLLSQ